MIRTASRDVEVSLAGQHGVVAGMDEVGRGSLAGPVAVGVALVDADCAEPPEGLTDSKMLTPRRREALCGPCRQWVLAQAVGWSTSGEIDALGIIGALRLAGRRALDSVRASGWQPGVVLLDGSHDWLSTPQVISATADIAASHPSGREERQWPDLGIPVVTRVRADATCAVVSAASVLAKVARDAWMCAVDDPGYDWVHNKGYASPAHVRALTEMGPCALHRRSWRLPGVVPVRSMTPEASGSGMMVP